MHATLMRAMGGAPGDDETLRGGDAGAAGSLEIGIQAAGRYRIERLVATGGIGEIYEAHDLVLGSRVALKTLRPEVAASTTAVERLRR